MKKMILFATLPLFLLSCSKDNGEVKIQLPKDYKEKTLVVSHVTIDNIFKATRQEDLKIIYDTLSVYNGVAEMKLDTAGPAQYNIESPVISMSQAEFYASPGDDLYINIKSFDPLDYSVSGTELMEDMMNYISVTRPIQMEYYNFVNSTDSVTEEQAKAYQDRYDAAVRKFVVEHPQSQALPLIIMDLGGDDFKKAYDNMTPEAKKSILMPYAELMNREVEKMQKERSDEEARKAEVASGKIEAANFTLPDLDGKKVSLSDFRGKWVVLDFWGSWCGWCIKGFPALKEAYE
ncbi:MAG: redoxin domain-containing protein, partial [Muribaculaceae bacterium]|nr:redoxin domain-containing protein [Muribaculaceae bacterium]